MNQDKDTSEKEEGGLFTCKICNLQESYIYYGRTPKFLKSIVFLEDCFVIPNPFDNTKHQDFIVLGSECSICQRTVCSGCSVFYSKRFCKDCVKAHKNEFPVEVQAKLK